MSQLPDRLAPPGRRRQDSTANPYLRNIGVSLIFAAFCFATSGCTPLGFLASKVLPDVQNPPPARYHGMVNQTCAIMVWADQAVRADFGTVRADIGGTLQQLIVAAAKDEHTKDYLAGLKFTYPADSVVRFQDDNPQLLQLPITDLALKLGIPKLTRLIYVEVEDFQTRFANSRELYRGSAKVTLNVVEITGNTAKVAFQEPHIQVFFPRNGAEALPGSDTVNDQSMYKGTIDALANTLAARLRRTHGINPPCISSIQNRIPSNASPPRHSCFRSSPASPAATCWAHLAWPARRFSATPTKSPSMCPSRPTPWWSSWSALIRRS